MKHKPTRTIRKTLLILAAFMLCASAHAQTGMIKFTKTQLTVREALAEIKAQTGYGMAFNGREFDAGRKVELTSAELMLDVAMAQILDGSGYTYVRGGNFISITRIEKATPKKAAEPAQEFAAVNGRADRNNALTDPTSGRADRNIPLTALISGPQPAQRVDSVVRPETVPGTDPKTDSGTDPGTDPKTDPKTDPGTDPKTDPATVPATARGVKQAGAVTAAVAVAHDEQDSVREPDKVYAAGWISIPTVGLKTNLLYDLTATVNLGLEFRLGDRASFDVPVNWNPFTFRDNRKWRHILVQPELRLWTRETFAGHFFGLHSHYAFYNVGNLPRPFSQYMREHRFQGWLAGVGVSYGYRWNFNHHWGMEATVGVGYAYLDYEKYACGRCGESFGKETKNYFGPTKVGLSLVYNIGRKKQSVSIPVPAPEPVPELIPEPFQPLVTEPEPEPIVILPYAPQFAVSYVVPEAEAVKVRSEAGKAYLDFAVGKAEIVPDFKNNAAELDKIYAMIRDVRENPDATITGIAITGYASPEGAWATNKTLSEKRAQALKNQIKMVTGYADSFFTVEGRGEDWATLDSLVARSDMTHKYAILEIIRGSDVFDGRERRLISLSGGVPYRQIKADLFPQLRRTEYQLQYTVLPFTVEKGKEVFKTRPSSLSLNEMFLIADTYAPGSDEFNEIFETAARIFPQDDAANLNAASSALERGDAVQAEKYLSKVRSQTAEYHNNTGVLHGLRGEWDKAAAAFVRARAAGGAEAVANAAEIERKLENIAAIVNAEAAEAAKAAAKEAAKSSANDVGISESVN